MPTFLRSLIETKKAAPGNAVARAVAGTRGGFYGGAVANASSWDLEQALRSGYERVIWVYRCVDAIASNSSGVPIVVREYNDLDGKVIEDPEIDKLFNRRPNIYETAQQFRYRVATQALLSRRGVFIEVVRNRMGRPVELHILPSSQTTPIPDAKNYVARYEVNTVTQGIVELNPDQVIWMRVKPHPTDVYAQMTPLVAAGLAADTDFLARLYNRNFLINDGRPGMLIAVAGGLGNEDAEELKRRFHGGPGGAGQTTVIEADGISVNDMSASPRDVQWQEAVRGSKEDILLAFGVPESVLGNASGRTFDNADAEFEVFWEVTMQPFMDAMAASYDVLTVGGMDDNLLVAHDYDTVDVLQRKRRRDRANAMQEVASGLKTIDEFFKETGQQPYDVPGTKVLWVPPGSVPVGKDDETTEAAQKLMPVGAQQPMDPSASAQMGAQQGSMLGATAAMNIQAARAWRLAGRKSHPLARKATGYPKDGVRNVRNPEAWGGAPVGTPIHAGMTPQNDRSSQGVLRRVRVGGLPPKAGGIAAMPLSRTRIDWMSAEELGVYDRLTNDEDRAAYVDVLIRAREVEAANNARIHRWPHSGASVDGYDRWHTFNLSPARVTAAQEIWSPNAQWHVTDTSVVWDSDEGLDQLIGAIEQMPPGKQRANMNEALRKLKARRENLRSEKSLRPFVEFKAMDHPYGHARTRVESEIGGLISAWSRRQLLAITERIGGVKARKGTRHWEGTPGTKALNASYIVSPDTWADDLVESMTDLFRNIAEREALKAARQLEKSGVLAAMIADGRAYPGGRTALDKVIGGRGLGRDAVLGYPVTVVEDMIRRSALRQSQKVADKIAQMDADGASIDEIKKEVRKMVGSRSSWKRGLSVAAATTIMEGARNSVYAQGGRYVKRVWRTMHDEKVRPSHKAAYGQERAAGRPFRVGGHSLMFPGDPAAPIEETANCRCWVELKPDLPAPVPVSSAR